MTRGGIWKERGIEAYCTKNQTYVKLKFVAIIFISHTKFVHGAVGILSRFPCHLYILLCSRSVSSIGNTLYFLELTISKITSERDVTGRERNLSIRWVYYIPRVWHKCNVPLACGSRGFPWPRVLLTNNIPPTDYDLNTRYFCCQNCISYKRFNISYFWRNPDEKYSSKRFIFRGLV